MFGKQGMWVNGRTYAGVDSSLFKLLVSHVDPNLLELPLHPH